ncbi:Cof-type HAD-IIB family hydrolase [Lacticaseibacillus zhaodongensis]|uniref:Cof-type HAD-IIB family hydrolase n=1 Tax=Lacticaseibacillus zhaodongensis TaxID=2668065 RepID=UPI001E645DEB|nr:Cof-type HAD-IIB family hydrolase [Lacticaseibacillus zhaodongensis]
MQERKLVAVDMDGTFLNDAMDYDRPRFAKLHEQMVNAGVRFVVASGNQYFQLRSFFTQYPDTIYLSENGALIRDDEQVYFKAAYDRDTALAVIDVLESYPAVSWTACGYESAYVLKTAGADYITDVNKYYHRLQLIDNPGDINDEILKFSTHCPASETADYVAEYARRLQGLAEPTSSGHGDIDIIQPGMNKAKGLKELARVLGVRQADVIAFGNGGNDIEMLQYAGDGVAVANADPDVLKAADHVAPSNNDSGVLAYVEQLVGAVTD